MSDEWKNEEVNAGKLDYRHYLNMLRRRHILFLSIVLAGWLLVWGGSWFLPAQYKSSTQILVDPSTFSKNYVSPGMSDNLQDRLQSITQQIMSRTRLLTIINKFHLYTGGKHSLTPDQQVKSMRKDIDVELIRNPNSDVINSFSVTYHGRDPRVVQSVTGELTNLFMNENQSAREQQALQTTQFIQDQLAAARAKMASYSSMVSSWPRKNQKCVHLRRSIRERCPQSRPPTFSY